METTTMNVKKAPKEKAATAAHANLRVRKETARVVTRDLEKINKKEFGRRVYAADFIALAVSLVRPEHLGQLQDASLSDQDHFDRTHAAYCEQHGKVPKGAYLGMIMRGEIPAPMAANATASPVANSEKSA